MMSNQRGAVSLLSVTFVSVIILLITVAMVRMMVGELRQATDAENSIRAYFAAEAASEEAYMGVKKQLEGGGSLLALNQNCDAAASLPTAVGAYINPASSQIKTATNDTVVTCRKVRTYGQPKGVIYFDPGKSLDQVAQVDLSNFGNALGRIELTWDVEGDASVVQAPPIELAVTNYPNGTIANAGAGIFTRNLLLDPCKPVGSTCLSRSAAGQEINVLNNLSAPISTGSFQVPTFCKDAAVYRCSATLKNIASPGENTVLRIRPLLRSMRYEMRVYDTSGNLIDVRLQYADIDVTVRVGDSYRRIQQQVQIRSGALAGLDAVSAQQDICKDFRVLRAPGYERIDPDLCPIGF